MADKKINLENTNEKYREILLSNLSKFIVYFKSFKRYDSQKMMQINNRLIEIKKQYNDLKQQMKDVAQKYRNFVFDDENNNMKPLRGDNGFTTYYAEMYNNMLIKEQKLNQQLQEIYNDSAWRYSQILGLLSKTLQIQLKLQEVQEAITWRHSEEYASINRYEKDEEPEADYGSMLNDYKAELYTLCEKCLNYSEINAYIRMCIADSNVRKIQDSKTPRHTK